MPKTNVKNTKPKQSLPAPTVKGLVGGALDTSKLDKYGVLVAVTYGDSEPVDRDRIIITFKGGAAASGFDIDSTIELSASSSSVEAALSLYFIKQAVGNKVTLSYRNTGTFTGESAALEFSII